MKERRTAFRILPAVFLFMLIIPAGCGMENASGGMPYKETKSMVLDILKTEDGKKAIQEATQEQGKQGNSEIMRMLSSKDGQQIQMAVKNVLTDPSYPKHLEKMMTDPKFAAEFAKAVQKENKKIHKDLMKDPEYQTLMIETMNNPEFKKMLFEVMKGKDYRKQTMMVMQEAMQTPVFRAELIELLKKALEEESKPKEMEKKEKGGGGGGGQS